MAPLLRLARFGLAGRLGSGRQYWSWISIEDEVAAIMFALTNDGLSGAVNATAPNPVTNGEFIKTLGRVLHRPTVLPAPRAGLAVVMGREMADVMLLAGQRVLPARLQAAGFSFAHPELEGALRAML
jgi:uncharacterized protein (TIGR01777 family)